MLLCLKYCTPVFLPYSYWYGSVLYLLQAWPKIPLCLSVALTWISCHFQNLLCFKCAVESFLHRAQSVVSQWVSWKKSLWNSHTVMCILPISGLSLVSRFCWYLGLRPTCWVGSCKHNILTTEEQAGRSLERVSLPKKNLNPVII